VKANDVGRRVRLVSPAFLVLLASLVLSGCSERDLDDLAPATAPANPVVFSDAFEGGLDYSAFRYSYYEAFEIDHVETYQGTASLRVTIPDGQEFAGGSFFSQGPRDLSGFNALVFHARASREYAIDAIGFGVGISYPSDYQSEVKGIALDTVWRRYVIPIPNSARMTMEHGLFWYSTTSGGTPVTIWFDEVEFARVSGISNPRPVMPTRAVQAEVGGRFTIPGTRTTFTVDGADLLVHHTHNHFDYTSSDPSVVTAEGNEITGVSLGEATITAALRGVDVQGVVTAKVVNEVTRPEVFIDDLDTGLEYGSFNDGQDVTALSVDNTGGVDDSAALRVTILPTQFAGGAIFSTDGGRDLTSFNALVFDARADQAGYVLGSVGYGIGMSAGGTDYQVEIQDVELGTEWRRVVVPIPDAARLAAEAGMFWYSAGQEGSFWLDNIQFTRLDDDELADIRPVMDSRLLYVEVGQTVAIERTRTIYDLNGFDVTVTHGPLYFSFESTAPSIAFADGNLITGVSLGDATITATLRGVDVQGVVNVQVVDEAIRPDVFIDSLDTGLDYGSFGDGQDVEALSEDATGGVNDSAALRVAIQAGRFAGGAIFSTDGGRDLTSFNALVFDARADQAGYVLGNVGYGIGMSAGGTDYQAEIQDVELGTDWRRVVVPIPDAARLGAEAGMFWYSAGQVGSFWLDNIRFDTLDEGELADPRPVMNSANVVVEIGDIFQIEGVGTTYSVGGTDVAVAHGPLYFTFNSSNEAMATVSDTGLITVVGGGTATITATLGSTPVDGSVTLTVIAPPSVPAPTPTHDAAGVISLFSDAYDDITVDTWLAGWSSGVQVEDQQIQDDNVKAYTGLDHSQRWAGIEFLNEPIDAASAGMTHFHMHVYVPTGTQFGFKLVDFGANGVFGGGDDTEAQIDINATSTPPLVTGQWMSLDIPLTDLDGMNFGHVAQLVLHRTNTGSVWIDNVYFHD